MLAPACLQNFFEKITLIKTTDKHIWITVKSSTPNESLIAEDVHVMLCATYVQYHLIIHHTILGGQFHQYLK